MICLDADTFIAFGTMLGGAGALIAGVAAGRALNTWRTQLKSQTRFDTAKRLLIAAHDLAERFHAARSPFILSTERSARFGLREERDMTPSERADCYREIFKGRWEPVRVRAATVIGLLPEIQTLFPPDMAEATRQLLTPAWKLRVSMGDYVDLLETETGPAAAEPAGRISQEWLRVRLDVFGSEPRPTMGTDNPLTLEFIKHHEALAKKVRPYVELSDT